MAGSQSSLTENPAEGLHKGKCKYCKPSLEYMTANRALLTFKFVDSNKTYQKKFDEDLLKRFKNISKLLSKGLYEYMDGWESFSEISLPQKKEFYRNLTMKNITDAGYKHVKKI